MSDHRRHKRGVKRRGVEGVIGLDLSLTSPAAAWIPRGWRGDTRQVRVAGKGWGSKLKTDATPLERLLRQISIAEGVIAFCRANPAAGVFVEQYAFAAKSGSAAEIHEGGGIVKLAVYRETGHAPIPVTASAARKTMLQRVPKKGSKEWTEDNVRRLGKDATYWSADEVDAVVVANHGALVLGWTPISFPGT